MSYRPFLLFYLSLVRLFYFELLYPKIYSNIRSGTVEKNQTPRSEHSLIGREGKRILPLRENYATFGRRKHD